MMILFSYYLSVGSVKNGIAFHKKIWHRSKTLSYLSLQAINSPVSSSAGGESAGRTRLLMLNFIPTWVIIYHDDSKI
jgi:hypothetical protein